jgi:putative transposase
MRREEVVIGESKNGMPVSITVREVNHLNNSIEQDHCAIKRVTRSMLGFKSFRAASKVVADVELI